MTVRTTLAAIDAGSNAIRVVVAELTATGLNRIEAERVPVRLGHGAFTRGVLDTGTIDAAVAAFKHFRAAFDRHGVVRYRAVATSAVRTAENRDVLLHRLAHEASIELDIIDGDEEARLIRKAVTHAFGTRPLPRGVLDLGGGSLEVNLYDPARTRWRGYSAPIGTVRLLETMGLDGAIADSDAGMVRRYVATVLQTVVPAIRDLTVAAACGGNAEALARLLAPSAPDTTAMPGFELAALEQILPELLPLSVDGRMERYGVRRDRAEVLGVAALVLATVGRQLGIARFIAPGVGIREAVLLELAEAVDDAPGHGDEKDKAVVTAARMFASRVDHDTSHGEQVRRLARALFTQLRDLHQLPERLGVVLEVAALLHDVGEVVHTRGHHKHSEYMIRWGRIPGLADPDRELVATLARGHRKSASEARRVIAESTLPKDQRGPARRLLALLRLADGIDSGHRQRFEGLVASRAGGAVVLDLVTTADAGHAIDTSELLRKRDLFEEEFGCTVQLTIGRPVLPELPEVPRGDGGSTARSLGRRHP
ncbi:MAG: Ppx/GppA family phosphatase [Myxococcales bacterium]|nr:Ppx/GppA family phosphatase [Myxococcales bacterium]